MKNKGFSFIELLVAVAILGIISLPIASSFALAAQINAKARAVSAAGNAADDVLLLITEIDDMPDDMPKDTSSGDEMQDGSWIYADNLASYASEQNQHIISDLQPQNPASGGWEYTFRYNGYDAVLTITDCDLIYRVDIALTYHVSGDTMTITRKGVLSR